jgi:SAM-dependent methyltransferase
MDISSDRKDVRSRAKFAYERIEVIWPEADDWSVHTREQIADCVARNLREREIAILNAGCGGNDYGLSSIGVCTNIDISFRQCRNLSNSMVGDIEALPFGTSRFDAVVCVGAVINYSEPYASIPELLRVTRSGGLLLLDFETTTSAELLFSNHWGKRVSVVERSYADRTDKTFLFSPDHIMRILDQYGAKIVHTHCYHTATAIWRRAFPTLRLPQSVLSSDRYVSQWPGIKLLASNITFVCQKN